MTGAVGAPVNPIAVKYGAPPMPAVNNVLVVGGGLAGAATAIHLAAAGVAVDLVEIKPDVAALGSGITLQGNALRELRVARRLGPGAGDGLRLRHHRHPRARPGRHRRRRDRRRQDRRPGPAGRHGHAAPGAGPDPRRPRRPRSASRSGSARRSPSSPRTTTGVDVTFADGSTGRYDLVVGADGVRSWTRRALGINLETKSVGMGIWRAFGPRPAERHPHRPLLRRPVLHRRLLPHRRGLALRLHRRGRAGPQRAHARGAAGHDEAAVAGLPRPVGRDPRDAHRPAPGSTTPGSRPHVLDAPWNRGRVVLIGDAAHTCPPTIAQGGAHGPRGRRRPRRAADRARRARPGPVGRLPRPPRTSARKTVVDASNQLAQWQLDHVQGDIPSLMRRIAMLVSQPA